MQLVLLLSVFLIAVSGLVYELLAGTISSYLVGDSVYQFSIVTGLFMSSMGIGSFLSRYVSEKLHDWFVFVETMTGVTGGLSSIVLFLAFAKLENYTPVLFIVSIIIGTFIGLELPIVLRIIKEQSELKIAVSNVMTADYIAALFASLLFPLVLVPNLGLIRTSLLFGLINVAVAYAIFRFFKERIVEKSKLTALIISGFMVLGSGFVFADKVSHYSEDVLYKDDIIYSAQSPYQRVVVTKGKDDIRMYINGSIQFSSLDEYRYHESLVFPPMLAAANRKNILIIGGGDGMAAREVFKFKEVERVVMVDIDPAITNFAKDNPVMRSLNCDSMRNSKLIIVNDDAWKYLETTKDFYDVIIVDLPDPDDLTLSRLYSKTFYRLLAHKLSLGGKIVTQATSPVYSTKAFWCIYNTIKAVENPMRVPDKPNEQSNLNMYAEAYRAYVPSFGEWGFVMGSNTPIDWKSIKVEKPGKYLSNETLATMNVFPPDINFVETQVNTIDTHVVKTYYDEGWGKWSI